MVGGRRLLVLGVDGRPQISAALSHSHVSGRGQWHRQYLNQLHCSSAIGGALCRRGSYWRLSQALWGERAQEGEKGFGKGALEKRAWKKRGLGKKGLEKRGLGKKGFGAKRGLGGKGALKKRGLKKGAWGKRESAGRKLNGGRELLSHNGN